VSAFWLNRGVVGPRLCTDFIVQPVEGALDDLLYELAVNLGSRLSFGQPGKIISEGDLGRRVKRI
jgi:hypothetical protein